MANPNELLLPFAIGIKRFAPEIVLGTEQNPIPLRTLTNFRMLDSSLRAIWKKVSEGSFPAETYLAINGYVGGTSVFWVYVVTDDNIYQLSYSGGKFTLGAIPLYSFSSSLTEFVDTAAWESSVHIVSHEFNVLRAKGSGVAEVDFGLWGEVKAKHVLVADDRVLYGNLIQNGNKRPYRLLWSDLYSDVNFEVSESSEAGSYDVGFNRNVITGLTEQHGRINIFTQNSIVQARYIGITQGTYQFETLYNGLGNLYHYSVVHVKEADFFISRDNFYILEGTTVTPIGDDIWNVWKKIRKNTRETDIRGYFNELDTEVYWTILANGEEGTTDNELWDLCYNYKQQQWYLRKNISADFFHYDYDISLGHPWTDYPLAWNNAAYSGLTWADLNTPITDKNIEIYLDPSNGLDTVDRDTFLPEGVACVIETHDIALSSVFSEKELDSVKIVFEGLDQASANLQVSVGSRDSFHETVAWSGPYSFEDNTDVISYIRKSNVGKLLRLKLTWTNSDASYIERVVGIALRFTTPIDHALDR